MVLTARNVPVSTTRLGFTVVIRHFRKSRTSTSAVMVSNILQRSGLGHSGVARWYSGLVSWLPCWITWSRTLCTGSTLRNRRLATISRITPATMVSSAASWALLMPHRIRGLMRMNSTRKRSMPKRIRNSPVITPGAKRMLDGACAAPPYIPADQHAGDEFIDRRGMHGAVLRPAFSAHVHAGLRGGNQAVRKGHAPRQLVWACRSRRRRR